MGYENCSLQTRENLQEIARMAYGSGWFEGRSGGAGRIGIWKTEDGQCRVVKFNTKISERLGGASMADDSRMLESCNRLRQELILIARSAGVDVEVMRQIRAKLGLGTGDGTAAAKLLDRSDVADVVTLIGGDKIWDDALRGRDMKDYKSDAHTSFKSLSEREFKVSSNVSKAIQDDGSRLTADSVRRFLVNARDVQVCSPLMRGNKHENLAAVKTLYDNVFDDDFVAEFKKAMTLPDGGYDEQSVTTRLETCSRLFSAACVKPDGTVNQLDERLRGDLIAACRLEVGSGSVSAFMGRLDAAGVTLADCFARGGSVIFANKKAIAIFQSVLEGLVKSKGDGILTKESCREMALRACENIAWVLEQGVACCTNEPDRYRALQAVASRFLVPRQPDDDLELARKAAFRDEITTKSNIGSSDLALVATLAQGVGTLRAAREEARNLVALHQLGDLLPADDVLLSSQTDPLSTAGTLFSDDIGEEKLIRAQFVQYRLAMLKAVTGMLESGTLTRDAIGDGVLAELLTGSVRENLANHKVIKERLNAAAYEALSTVKTFRSGILVPMDNFAAEFLAPSAGFMTAEFMQGPVRTILERQFRRIVDQSGPIVNEDSLKGLFDGSRNEFNAIVRGLIIYMSEADVRTVVEKDIDLSAILGEVDETFEKNAPALRLLVAFARQEEKPDTGVLIARAKEFLQKTSIDKVFPDRQFSRDDAKLYDFVRVQFWQDVDAEKIKLAYDGFLKLVDEMAESIAGGGDARAKRSELVAKLSSRPLAAGGLAKEIASLAEQDGLDKISRQWKDGFKSIEQLRNKTDNLRKLVDKQKFREQNPFAFASTDMVLKVQLGFDVVDQLAAWLAKPNEAKGAADKALSRLETRQSLINTYVKEIGDLHDPKTEEQHKDLFVKRTMLRMLSSLLPKHLDSEDKARKLEEHIRAKLNENGGLWKFVQDVRTALTREGRKADGCSDEEFKALIGLQLRSAKQIFNFCFLDADAKKILFDGKEDVGAEEEQDFLFAAVKGFTYGDPAVLAAVEEMARSGQDSELNKKLVALTQRLVSMANSIDKPDQVNAIDWNESDRYVFRLITEKDHDQASAGDGKTILTGMCSLKSWREDVFDAKAVGQ